MSTKIQHYQFHTHQLRAMPDEQGESWFIAKDVCEILGYSNSARTINDLCRKSGIRNTYLPMFSANYKMIDEGNLYRLIIKSNKPESEPFENWVCDEVLPSIRKTGSYQADNLLTSKQQQQFEALKQYALRGNKVWSGIARYKKMGLNHAEIGRLYSRPDGRPRSLFKKLTNADRLCR